MYTVLSDLLPWSRSQKAGPSRHQGTRGDLACSSLQRTYCLWCICDKTYLVLTNQSTLHNRLVLLAVTCKYQILKPTRFSHPTSYLPMPLTKPLHRTLRWSGTVTYARHMHALGTLGVSCILARRSAALLFSDCRFC